MNQQIEQNVAATILEQPIGTITIDGKTFEIPAPTTATLIMVANHIADLPELDTEVSKEEFIPRVMAAAADAHALGQIAATLVLGAKRIKEHPLTTITKYTTTRKWSWRYFRKVEKVEAHDVSVFEQDYFAQKILDGMTPRALNEFISGALSEAHLADFFVLTTSLRTKSILTPTREVGETTASGASSGAGLNIGN